jgi:hypothetical protein
MHSFLLLIWAVTTTIIAAFSLFNEIPLTKNMESIFNGKVNIFNELRLVAIWLSKSLKTFHTIIFNKRLNSIINSLTKTRRAETVLLYSWRHNWGETHTPAVTSASTTAKLLLAL